MAPQGQAPAAEVQPQPDVHAVERKPWYKWPLTKIGAGVAALALAGAGGLWAGGVFNGGDSDAEAPGYLPTDPTEQEAAIRDALTVTSVSVDCVEVAEQSGIAQTYDRGNGTTGVKYDVGAVKPVGNGPNERHWSDALSTAFQSDQSDNEAMLTEIQASICEDPELGSTLGNLFSNMDVRGVKVLDLNPWMKTFAGDASNINDVAASFITLKEGNENPTDEQLAEANQRNEDWEKDAEKLGTLLERFMVAGVGEGQTILNYHLTAGGLVVPGLPEVGLNPNQMQARAFRFILSEKPGTCIVEIGFNVGDKRPEMFNACVVLPPFTPENPKVPGVPPETPTVPTTPTTPTTTPIPKGSPAPTLAPPPTVPGGGSGSGGGGKPEGGLGGGGDSGPGAPDNGISPPTTEQPPATLPGNETPATGHPVV